MLVNVNFNITNDWNQLILCRSDLVLLSVISCGRAQYLNKNVKKVKVVFI